MGLCVSTISTPTVSNTFTAPDNFIKFDGCPYAISTDCLESVNCWHVVYDQRTGEMTEMCQREIEPLLQGYGINDVISAIHPHYSRPSYLNQVDKDRRERIKQGLQAQRELETQVALYTKEDADLFRKGEISKNELVRRGLELKQAKLKQQGNC